MAHLRKESDLERSLQARLMAVLDFKTETASKPRSTLHQIKEALQQRAQAAFDPVSAPRDKALPIWL